MRSCCLSIAILYSVIGVGCGSSGPELARVSGTVKMDGAPLKDAFVTFTPEQAGRPSFGGTNADGYYDLVYTDTKKGALPGQHTVKVSTYQGANPEAGTKAQPERVPAKYNTKSELKRKVEPGSNTIDIEISSSDGKVVQPAK
jgi:hypothetical protein